MIRFVCICWYSSDLSNVSQSFCVFLIHFRSISVCFFSIHSVYLTQLRCFRFISILFRSVKFFCVYMYTHKYYICLNNTLTLCVALTVSIQKICVCETEKRRPRRRRKRSTKWEKMRRRRRIKIRRHVSEKNGTNCVISNYSVGCCCYCCYCYSFVCWAVVRLFVYFGFFFRWLKFVNVKCLSIPKVIKSSISQQMTIIYI